MWNKQIFTNFADWGKPYGLNYLAYNTLVIKQPITTNINRKK